MLAVFAVLVAAATILLIEGSLAYYLTPSAPDWLRRNKDAQTTISCLFVNGLIAALFMFGQYLVDLGTRPASVIDIGLAAAVVVGFVVLWRRLHARHERLRRDAAATVTPPNPAPRPADQPTLRAA